MNVPVPALRAEALRYRIRGLEVVCGFGFELQSGQVLGLIGPNGAGKTTAIDLLSGFSAPESGRVFVCGRDVTRWPSHRRCRAGLARTFQGAPAIAGLTVAEHLRLASEATGHRPLVMRLSPAELLGRLGLAALRDLRGEDLPVPERHLLDLARALATRPAALLLDEPFSGLEHGQVELVLDEIRQAAAGGMGILVVDHRLGLLVHAVQSAIVLVEGRELVAGTMQDILRNPAVQEAYLGTPVGAEPSPREALP